MPGGCGRHPAADSPRPGILPFANPDGRHAHNAFHRFLREARWEPDTLWKLLAVLLVKLFTPQGVIELDLDDTLLHRWGRKVEGADWYPDNISPTFPDAAGTRRVHFSGQSSRQRLT